MMKQMRTADHEMADGAKESTPAAARSRGGCQEKRCECGGCG